MRPIDADALLKELPIHPDGGMRSVKDESLMIRVRETVKNAPTVGGWISVKDRMPPNADNPGAFCPRYLVQTKYGTTEGWYNPDKGCWYTLVWFLIGRYTEDDIDMERGDIPRISSKIEVSNWMSLPEPPDNWKELQQDG